jgi:hypothetical protein
MNGRSPISGAGFADLPSKPQSLICELSLNAAVPFIASNTGTGLHLPQGSFSKTFAQIAPNDTPWQPTLTIKDLGPICGCGVLVVSIR